jgi:tRNA-modifying protein YgfZ
MSLDTWRWLEVQSGIVTIEAATVDRFVPQMVNFELVGGVDFQKGCYPGQEVVARSHYRGTTRRRTFLFDCDTMPVAGQDVFVAGDTGEAAGTVANAAPRPDGIGGSALVEVRLAALAADDLRLGSPSGPRLRRAELGYRVPLEAEPAK